MVNTVHKAGEAMGMEKLPEEEFTCPKHGKYRGQRIKIAFLNHIQEPPCPECVKEEAEIQAREDARREEEERRRKRERWLSGLNIGKRYWDVSFDNFDAYTDELKNHLANCIDFANNHLGRKLVMLGNNGTGKNHLAASILKTTGGIIHTVYEIELMLKQSYSGDTQEWRVIQELCDADMLVIDEIGRTKGGDWELNWLSYVINKRHENLMPLILISNKHLKEDCQHEGGCPDCLQNWVGNDILSRIIEDGLVMMFTGEDYRHKKRLLMGGGNAR